MNKWKLAVESFRAMAGPAIPPTYQPEKTSDEPDRAAQAAARHENRAGQESTCHVSEETADQRNGDGPDCTMAPPTR